MADLTYTRLAERNVSFQLLRTNPKLTSNVKLTVDSTGDLWLNSISANEQLANQKYKRFAINETSNHEVNLYRFYDNGKTPSAVAYELGSTIGKTASAKDLKDQFDFDLYTSGAKYLKSRQYSEKFSYLAPIYLDQVKPGKFVIFKIPGASNYTAGQGKSISSTLTTQEFATDMFKNATLVKVFDMGPDSKIGKYLENISKNPMFTTNPLYVNYKQDGYSLYRGASIKTGTYVEQPEQLSTVLSRALPLLKVEQFVTQGFERNSIVHPKVINLEFLFDDDTSETYTFNRYFGFYCNDIDLETFDIDLKSMFESRIETANTPDLLNGIAAAQINGGIVHTIAEDPTTNKLYIGGTFTSYNGHTRNRIARLNQDGSIDHSFVIGAGFDSQVNVIKLDKSGNVYVGGSFSNYNGTNCSSFIKLDSTGSIISSDCEFDSVVNDILITAADELFIAGEFLQYTINSNITPCPGLIKLSLDLSVNSGFSIGTGFDCATSLKVNSIAMKSDNKLIAVGQFDTYQGSSANGIVQLNEDGSIDLGFDYGTGFNSITSVNKVVLDYNDNSYIGGQFTQYNGTNISNLIKLDHNGLLDSTYSYQTGTNGPVTQIAKDFDGKLYVAGAFTAYKGVPARGLIRISINGELDYTFDTSTGFNNLNITDILLVEENVYISGGFTKFQEQSVSGLINLDNIALDNDQYLPYEFKTSDDISFTLTNPAGVKLRAMNLTQDLSDLAKNRTDQNTLFFPYLKTKNDDLHLINSEDWIQSGNLAEFKIDNTTFDLGLTFGPLELIVQETASYSTENTKSTISVTLTAQPNSIDVLRVYHPSGSRKHISDPNGTFDDLVFTRGYLPITEAYTLGYSSFGTSTIYINADRDIEEINQAIVDVIDKLIDTSISGVNMGDTCFLQTNKYGDAYGELKARFIPGTLDPITYDPQILVKLNNEYTLDVVYADGGFDKAHAIISSENISKLTPILNEIVIKTNQDWSKVHRLCRSTDKIVTGLSDSDKLVAINYFNNKASIQLTDDETVNVSYDKIEIRKVFRPKIGVLSMFEVMDFDFTTQSTDYARNLGLDIYRDFYIPAGVKMLDFTKYTYKVIGDGTVSVNGVDYTASNLAPSGQRELIWQNTETISSYQVKSGKAILIYGNKLPNTTVDPNNPNFPNRLDLAYNDETNDAIDYIGPFSIKASHAPIDSSISSYPYREKYIASNVTSEYGVYLENFTTDFATEGRVIPYINKWGIIDSTDVRDNPYRLNSDILFGKDNFGPSHRETSPTPEKLTHEWFYLESDFGYTKDAALARSNYYYFDQPLNVNSLISTDSYFEQYFTYIPSVDGEQVARPQYRYSVLNKNQFTKQYETLFKGAMFKFYELDSLQKAIADSSRFDDYKFSVILKPVNENPSIIRQPVKYRVIENTNSKSITVLIELAIGGKDLLNNSLLLDSFQPANGNIISQNTLFAKSFTANPETYSIDVVVEANSFNEYFNLLNGAAVIPAGLGQTVQIIYGNYSSVIATEGSAVYSAVRSAKISTGDSIGQRRYAIVDQSVNLVLSSGSYTGISIQSELQDAWLYTSSTTVYGLGSIGTDNGMFDLTTSALRISSESAASNPPSVELPFSGAGSLDYTDLFNSQFALNYDPINASVTYYDLVSGISEEVLYTITATSGTILPGDPIDLSVIPVSGQITSPLANGSTVLLFKTKLDLPTLGSISQNSLEFTVEHRTPYLESMLGDYRVEFNQEDVSNLTYSFLYYAKHKKYNSKKTAYSTIKLSRGVDLSPSGVEYSGSVISSLHTNLLPGLENYDALADSEIAQISNDFAPIYVIRPDEKFILVQVSNPTFLLAGLSNQNSTTDGIDGASLDMLTVTNKVGTLLRTASPTEIVLGDSVIYEYSSQSVPAGTTSTWLTNSNHFQIFGGVKYFEKVFENLSFAKFFELLDKSQSVISWESYTDGILSPDKKMSIEIVQADEINKSTVISIAEESVKSGQINQIAGYSLSESLSNEYEVNRYSSEYEVITKPVAGYKYRFTIGQNVLEGANVCLNPLIDNFFIIPEFEYIKFSKSTILDLENSQKYLSVYPLIDETPIDRTNFNMLASSWDYGYHFEYTDKSQFTRVPGTRRVAEDYSFVSKLLNLPLEFLVENFSSLEVSNKVFLRSTATEANIVFSRFSDEIRFKLNMPDLITKQLSNNGIKQEFEKFFKYSTGSQILKDSEFLGDLTFDQYVYQYCINNIIQLYTIGSFEFYELDDRTIVDNSVSFEEVEYDALISAGYNLLKSIRINNTKSTVIEGAVMIKPNTGVKLVPKIKIKFI